MATVFWLTLGGVAAIAVISFFGAMVLQAAYEMVVSEPLDPTYAYGTVFYSTFLTALPVALLTMLLVYMGHPDPHPPWALYAASLIIGVSISTWTVRERHELNWGKSLAVVAVSQVIWVALILAGAACYGIYRHF